MAKILTQDTAIKDPRIKEPKKAQEPKHANNSLGNAETSKIVRKEFKKRFRKEKCRWKNSNSSTLAIGNNTTSNNTWLKGLKKNLSETMYYNYYKKGYYTWTYSKLKKNNALKN